MLNSENVCFFLAITMDTILKIKNNTYYTYNESVFETTYILNENFLIVEK